MSFASSAESVAIVWVCRLDSEATIVPLVESDGILRIMIILVIMSIVIAGLDMQNSRTQYVCLALLSLAVTNIF